MVQVGSRYCHGDQNDFEDERKMHVQGGGSRARVKTRGTEVLSLVMLGVVVLLDSFDQHYACI